MAVEFCAIMDHHLTERQIDSLRELFNSTENPVGVFQECIIRLFEIDDANQRKWMWEDAWGIGDLTSLWSDNNPPGLFWHFPSPALGRLMWMYVYPKVVVFETRKGWTLITDPENVEYREALRAACRNLAAKLGSPAALYVPDSGNPESVDYDWTEECNLSEYYSRLRDACGPPATAITSIYVQLDESTYDTRGYFIDHFDSQ